MLLNSRVAVSISLSAFGMCFQLGCRGMANMLTRTGIVLILPCCWASEAASVLPETQKQSGKSSIINIVPFKHSYIPLNVFSACCLEFCAVIACAYIGMQPLSERFLSLSCSLAEVYLTGSTCTWP